MKLLIHYEKIVETLRANLIHVCVRVKAIT